MCQSRLLYSGKRTKKNGHWYKPMTVWSEWRDLNPRLPSPEPGALPTALHPEKNSSSKCRAAAVSWLEKKDSNPHKQSQSLSCYPYTILQYLIAKAFALVLYYYIELKTKSQDVF